MEEEADKTQGLTTNGRRKKTRQQQSQSGTNSFKTRLMEQAETDALKLKIKNKSKKKFKKMKKHGKISAGYNFIGLEGERITKLSVLCILTTL